ncbi:energy transducer TonB, partial [Citromicrobium bathyomarinum]
MDAKQHTGLDAIALIVAIALHAALIAVLLVQGATREKLPEPQRITVNFAEDVGTTSTSPDPVREAQASVAPELGEQVSPPIEYVPPPPLPQPTTAPAPAPRPQPT